MYQFYRSAMKRFLLISMLMLTIFHFEILNAQQNPAGLGFLGTGSTSWAADITSNGAIVTGWAHDGISIGQSAFFWTEDSGMVGIGHLNPNFPASLAYAISANGEVITGSSSTVPNEHEAFRWTQNDGMQGLGLLPGDNRSIGWDVSADGAVIVGISIDPPGGVGSQGFRWTMGTGMVALPHLPGGISSSIKALSSNGVFAVGGTWNGAEGFMVRWDSSGTPENLGHLPGHLLALANDVSDDGSVIVGYSGGNGFPPEAFRWTQANGMQPLGIPSGANNSSALKVSRDGSVILIQAGSAYYIWDDSLGMRELISALQNEYGYTVSGWSIFIVTSLVAENRILKYLVGRGTNSNGDNEAWRAVILSNIIAWSNSQGGGFSNDSNWVSGAVPDTSQIALFDESFYTSAAAGMNSIETQPITITFDEVTATRGLNIRESQVIFDLQFHSYAIDFLNLGTVVNLPDESHLEIINGAVGTNTFHILIGTTGFHGELVIGTDGILEVDTDSSIVSLVVGANDCGGGECGRLIIQNGGVVFTNASGRGTSVIGSRGGEGSVFIFGNGSEWTDSSLVIVGDLGGIGLLDIQNPGLFGGKDMWLAFGDSSLGTVRISDPGSLLELEGELLMGIGAGVESHFTISNSATVFIKSKATIAFGGEGDITVEGTLSSLVVFDTTFIGKFGSGGLSVLGGGLVINNAAVMPGGNGGIGSALVDGASSKWTVNNTLSIGLLRRWLCAGDKPGNTASRGN